MGPLAAQLERQAAKHAGLPPPSSQSPRSLWQCFEAGFFDNHRLVCNPYSIRKAKVLAAKSACIPSAKQARLRFCYPDNSGQCVVSILCTPH